MRDALAAIDAGGTYNFEYITMTTQNALVNNRLNELNLIYVPTAYFDAGQEVVIGGYTSHPVYTSRINNCGARDVPEIDLSVTLTHYADSLKIEVSTTLNTYINSYPQKPPIPEGPQTGFLLVDHTYKTSTTDGDGDLLYYRFSWGDGDTTEWLGPFPSGDTASASHSWDVSSTYQIKSQAKDTLDAESDWSNSKWVYFTGYANMPPDQPPVPTGPSEGSAGVEYMFTGNTTDDEGEDLYYQWDWDGEVSDWMGPYASGADCEAAHSWSAGGTYDVMVRAKDINDNEGEWSDPKPVAISSFICGDANADQTVNVSDAVWIINFVFVGGDEPIPYESGEVNCDATVNVSDAVWIINFVFVGGDDPCDIDGDEVPDC